MKAKYINEGFSSSIGSGFSYNGGVGGGSFANSMYSYTIKSLNHTLEPKPFISNEAAPIHIGLTIYGKKFNDNKTLYFGKLIDIKRNINGSIKYYTILDEETSNKVNLNPNTVSIFKNPESEKKVNDIWNFDNRGNFHQKKRIHESKLVHETLDESLADIYAERMFNLTNQNKEYEKTYNRELYSEEEKPFLKISDYNTKIYKNPKNINKLDAWIRGFSDENGIFYICDNSSLYHTQLLLHLKNVGLLNNATYDKISGNYINCIAWERKDKTNDFYLSESYFMQSVYNKDILLLKQKVKEQNPQYNFYLEKIEDL